ncbi:MAG TPA: heparan-alpha-glucosaminide N-acetyltransferase [Methanocorpusculum sp.]|nr:heparan-alpha-glucosaminide N-acetyltransferase [Methanocorpusculum sp.]
MGKVWFFELDAARGFAIVLMILYHTIFCLYFFQTGLVPWFDPVIFSGAPICFMFVFIAGVSTSLMVSKLADAKIKAKKLALRAVKILLCAALVSLVTYLVSPGCFVIFGVLHLIGVSALLMIPFVIGKIKALPAAICGAVVIVLSFFTIRGPLFLLPLGFGPGTIAMLDYEPLVPWFGVILLGYAAGLVLYRGGARCKALSRLNEKPKALTPLCFLGRHSLIIYLIHVPVIILILVCIGLVPLPI